MNSYDIVLTLLLTAAVEFVTVVMRLVWHLKSAHVQRKIHWPRTHHSYVGIVLVALGLLGVVPSFVSVRATLIVGVALILSDVAHHVAMIPLIRRFHYDIRMVHHESAHAYLIRWSAVLAIGVGAIALLTPFTPGSWLLPMGFVTLMGKRRSRSLLIGLIGRRLYRAARLGVFFGHD